MRWAKRLKSSVAMFERRFNADLVNTWLELHEHDEGAKVGFPARERCASDRYAWRSCLVSGQKLGRAKHPTTDLESSYEPRTKAKVTLQEVTRGEQEK